MELKYPDLKNSISKFKIIIIKKRINNFRNYWHCRMSNSTKSEHCPKKIPSRKNKVLNSFNRPTIASTLIPVDKIVKECRTSNPVIMNLVDDIEDNTE